MITITNKNIYYSDFSLVELPSLDKIEIIQPGEIISFLSDNVELGESVTFKRLFELVSANLDKFNEIFYSSLGGYVLDPYLQEIENNPTEPHDMDYLEIHWFCDKYDSELNITPALHGISLKEENYFALDFESLNNLKNYIIRINEAVEIIDYIPFAKPDDDAIKKIELGNKSFTLFELFNAIFFEISFHGGPQDKKERYQEIEESITESELEQLEESEKFTTFEEILEKFDSEDKYLVKYKDLRERVNEDRLSIAKNLSKLKSCVKEKLKIFDIIENSDKDLKKYYKKLTDNEYSMQMLYGEDENIKYHRFWDTPKCTCPKIDNLELYPSDKPIFDKDCPIHKKS